MKSCITYNINKCYLKKEDSDNQKVPGFPRVFSKANLSHRKYCFQGPLLGLTLTAAE